MLIWTARVSKKTKAVVAVILAGILAAAVLLLVGRSGGGQDYLTYNELQDSQGFDLSACCGKQVARYTYTVTNYPGRPEGVQANLYVCEGQPVAGDILCAGADGFQDTLVYPEQD